MSFTSALIMTLTLAMAGPVAKVNAGKENDPDKGTTRKRIRPKHLAGSHHYDSDLVVVCASRVGSYHLRLSG